METQYEESMREFCQKVDGLCLYYDYSDIEKHKKELLFKYMDWCLEVVNEFGFFCQEFEDEEGNEITILKNKDHNMYSWLLY